MPIFPRFVPQQHNQTMDLNTLLSLLGEQSAASTTPHHYNQSPTHASAPSSSHPAAKATRSSGGSGANVSRAFTPNFDIFETATEYVLEGELPGLADKKAIDIEFTDHQTLLVKGRIEKNIHTSSSSATPTVPEARQIEAEKHTEEHPRPHTPPRPTVEDDIDEDDRASTVVMTPASTVVSHSEKAEKKPQQQQEKKEQIRYWVSERTIGSFQRTFSFPGLIDQDNVKARLENGLLTIVVPKRTKVESRRIEIQ